VEASLSQELHCHITKKEKNNTALSDKKRYKKIPSIYIDFRVRTPERRTRASAEEETEKS
jgi:hypothetical protein